MKITSMIKKRVGLRVGVIVSAVTALIIAIFGIIEYSISSSQMEDQLQEQANITADQLQQSLVGPLWDTSSDIVAGIIRSAMKLKTIDWITVVDPEKKEILANFRRKDGKVIEATNLPKPNEDLIVVSRNIVKGDATIGILKVHATTLFLKKTLETMVIRSFIALFLITIIVISTMMAVTKKYLLIPLREMKEKISESLSGDLNNRLTIESEDEFRQIADCYNSLIEMLLKKVNLSQEIAAKNLVIDVELASEQDTLGLALRKMVANLNKVIHDTKEFGLTVSTESTKLSSSSQDLSQATMNISASLEEISAALNEIESKVRENNLNVDQAKDFSQQMKNYADEGADKMNSMNIAIQEISKSSTEIAKIIKTIDGIAFQTNLLALNAAVEAARAGVHGKGFAVVAEEVRSLATRSAKAASDTTVLIEESMEKTKNGIATVTTTTEVFNKIVGGVDKVSQYVDKIAISSAEQSETIKGITQTIKGVESATLQNTAVSEETASAAMELNEHAGDLQKVLAQFRTTNQDITTKAAPTDELAPPPFKPEVNQSTEPDSLPQSA